MYSNKAVADGAISFYLDGFVTSRMAKFDYGQEVYVDYLASKESHRSRSGKVEVDCVGRAILVGAFDKILTKVGILSVEKCELSLMIPSRELKSLKQTSSDVPTTELP